MWGAEEMNAQANILVIDDDPAVLDMVEALLTGASYQVTTTMTGEDAISALNEGDFELAIVDLRLPGMDGLTLTRMLKKKSSMGVIILSGLGKTIDRVVGLEAGADDYMSKPFSTRELLARVRSVLRREEKRPVGESTESDNYVFEGWKLDAVSRKLTSPEGNPVELTSGEYDLLLAFVEHPNVVLSRDQVLDFTHRVYSPTFDRSVDVQLGRLRKKIGENPRKPQIIKTIRNAGYMFAAKVTRS